MDRDYIVRGKIWISVGEATFLGHGRIVLLERIQKYGSISGAARSMGMGYRHAWRLVASMNKEAPVPLVLTKTGGKRGGGASLTEAGRAAIRLFWKLHQDLGVFLEKETQKIEQEISSWKRGNEERG